jgi:integrase
MESRLTSAGPVKWIRPTRLCRCRHNHDLRHTFAVRTLLRWHEHGADIGAHLPALSTYLGHSEPTHTYWYLSATPELLALSAARLEATFDERP